MVNGLGLWLSFRFEGTTGADGLVLDYFLIEERPNTQHIVSNDELRASFKLIL
jgi:hypothetical protein